MQWLLHGFIGIQALDFSRDTPSHLHSSNSSALCDTLVLGCHRVVLAPLAVLSPLSALPSLTLTALPPLMLAPIARPTASLELSLPRTVDAALAGNTAVPQASRAARHRVRHLHSGVTRAATAPVAAKAGAAARVLALGDFVKFGHL
jgi:hypothetical protein